MFLKYRFFRAVCAIILCFVLLGAMVHHRTNTIEAKHLLRFNTATSTYKMSEAIYEGTQFLSNLTSYRHGQVQRDEVQLQFEVLWSRVSILLALDMTHRPLLEKSATRFLKCLKYHDPFVFSDFDPNDPRFDRLLTDIDELVVRLRQAWISEFNATRFNLAAEGGGDLRKSTIMFEFAIMGLLGLIVLYLLVELYFASMAQRREQDLREMATAASRAKSDFIATVSHEIRTPLNGILGMARMLADSKLDAEQRDSVRVLSEAGGVLLSTINDVLEFSKIGAGKASIKPSAFAVQDIVEVACKLYLELAISKNLSLEAKLPDPLPPMLFGDARRLRQVLHNLVSNALKFTQEGGVRIDVSYKAETGDLVIAVWDTGPGIPARELHRIFEPFAQTDATSTRDQGGTGLGLTISRDICRAMGGDLRAKSAPGRGSCFEIRLTLPVAEEQTMPANSDETATLPSFDSVSVLVVDDNKTNRLIMRKFLKAIGIVPVEAASGQGALDAYRANDFDVVFMDVRMPGMDGMEATRLIRQSQEIRPQTRSLVVGVTANVLPEQIETYLEAGMDFVLPKPVSKNQLINVLAHIAEGKPVSPEPGGEAIAS